GSVGASLDGSSIVSHTQPRGSIWIHRILQPLPGDAAPLMPARVPRPTTPSLSASRRGSLSTVVVLTNRTGWMSLSYGRSRATSTRSLIVISTLGAGAIGGGAGTGATFVTGSGARAPAPQPTTRTRDKLRIARTCLQPACLC